MLSWEQLSGGSRRIDLGGAILDNIPCSLQFFALHKAFACWGQPPKLSGHAQFLFLQEALVR